MPELLSASRRDFLKSLGGGMLVLVTLEQESLAQESGRSHRRPASNPPPQDVAAWLHIDQNGAVTAFTGKVEVGQNIRTSLPQAIADELHVQPGSIRLVMGDTALTPWDMGTFGSRTTPTMAPQLRAAAAAMREQLLTIAAKKWSVDRASLTLADGYVLQPASGRKAGYGEFASAADWTKVLCANSEITPPSERQYSGRSLSKLNARELVSGRHQFTSDMKRPGMLYGRVLRPPSFGAQLLSADTTAAAAIPNVTVVHESDFIGVAAPNEFIADKSLDAIKAQWREKSQIYAKDLFSYLKANPENGETGEHDTTAALPDTHAAKNLQSTYAVAYIAHVPLEPRAAVAEWQGSRLTVWTGTQVPFGVRSELAEAFQLTEENVRVIVPDTGAAYGGKHTGECAIEAARLAKAAGRPVKLVWTRQEEFTWAYFRPAGVIEVRSGVANDGTLTSWDFHNYNSGSSGLESPYRCPSSRARFHPTKYPLRQGSYRGLAATANHFARESHIDELALAVGMDPLAFRLKNLQNDRVRAVLEAAAGRFGWDKSKPTPTRGYGLSCGMEKGSYFACCAEISVTPNRQIRVDRVVEAFECGAIVNPRQLENQVEGAIIMGLGGALFEAIDFANGRILNPRLGKYPVPRFSDLPAVEVVLLDRRDLPSAGAGETPIMGIAPAIANGLFQATGVRVRSMPIQPAFQSGV
ncbi:MAG: xanthine dehydrogenase family protein molybdopterin-binding subunit [Acidobacteriaceae bacterium]|nr:xanthine dehydrogenase family protein molybdopterin-binding subunit [Acidobacteriaceae bacterium]